MRRRNFSRRGVLAAGAMGAMGAFQALMAGTRGRRPGAGGTGYGPLGPVADETTGLLLLHLPAGFRYRSFGWFKDGMADGTPTPSNHDGMAVVSASRRHAVLVRNHELSGFDRPFGADPSLAYDLRARGGTTTLAFDLLRGEWLGSHPSLSGTVRNCSGGPTPWGSWLSAEETLLGAAEGYDEDHGYVFEVPGRARTHPVPLRALGRFNHESVAVDARTGFVYETEDDRYTSGLYRLRPRRPHQRYGLEHGGTLEMLKVRGVPNADLQQVVTGDEYEVEWVPVPVPELEPQSGVGPFGSFDGQTTSCSGPFLQGYEAGGAQFRRLEGIGYDATCGLLFFVDTEGGRPALDTGRPEGTVWSYDPRRERLRVVYESREEAVLDNADNITVSPRGGIVLCEDGNRRGLRLLGLTSSGDVFDLARNDVVLSGEVNGISGDFRRSEWAGATFDPSGRWLFANVYSPGFTVAITGPWEGGGL